MHLKTFTLKPPPSATFDPRSATAPGQSRTERILVADDYEEARHVISKSLVRAGFKVDVVADGEEAWDALQRNQYHLLITDNDMPHLAGLELIQRVRDAGMNLPVIMTSGSFSEADVLEYAQLKIAAALTKPFAFWDFLSIVSHTLWKSSEVATAEPESFANTLLRLSQTAAKAADSGHYHVLIADDDPTVRGSLAAVLASEGYVVDEASNGIEAVSHAIRRKPDLVLLDLNMPHADGWTAFNQLDRATPLLPVIVITARPNQYQEAVRVGVDAFMEKPLNIPILVSAVKRMTKEYVQRQVSRTTNRAFVTQLLGGTESCRSTL